MSRGISDVIGPAGESKSVISGIVNDVGRIAARFALGAVRGIRNYRSIQANPGGTGPRTQRMSAAFTLVRKELTGLFASPNAYIAFTAIAFSFFIDKLKAFNA